MRSDGCTTRVDYQRTLRRLAVRDDRLVSSILSDEVDREDSAGLDSRTQALVRIAALITMNAGPPSFMNAVEAARDGGATAEEIVTTLITVMPVVGVARVVSAAPNLGLALGYDVWAALEGPGRSDARLGLDPS
jgi:4-carboxymuconolactone decarboxylase